MLMDRYQQAAEATAVFPEKNTVEYLSLGLASEAGEFAGKVAKHYRGDGALDRDKLAAELGDVLWFVALIAHRMLDMPLSEVALSNLQKLASRQARQTLKGEGDNR